MFDEGGMGLFDCKGEGGWNKPTGAGPEGVAQGEFDITGSCWIVLGIEAIGRGGCVDGVEGQLGCGGE